MYEFWYDYVKQKIVEKFCYMDTNSFIVYMKTDDIYKDIAKDVETRFDTSDYELDRPFPKEKNKNYLIGLMKGELGEKIMTKFFGLRAKAYGYLIDDSSKDKRAKGTKKCVIKKTINLKIIKTVQKQLNFTLEQNIQKKLKLT